MASSRIRIGASFRMAFKMARAEIISYVARVVGPVHAELEFLNQTGSDAQDEDEGVYFDPEEGYLASFRVPCAHVDDADDHLQQSQTH